MRSHLLFLCACAVACSASQPPSHDDEISMGDTDPPEGDGAAIADIESGIYVVLKVGGLTRPFDAPDGELAQLIARPYVHGLALSFNWADLEPTQGTYAPIVIDALEAVRSLAASSGKPLTVKVHLRNGLPPAWLIPSGIGTHIQVFTTTLGFRALGQTVGRKVDVTFVPTEQGYITRVRANIEEFARQLDVADPDATLVRIVQVAGPSSESGGTMRLTPREPFPRVGTDTLGFGWTFRAHLDAWKAMGPLMAEHEAYRKRQWTFDLTHQPPQGDSVFGLDTADQMSVTAALVASHPNGADGIRLMNEGASAQSNSPEYPTAPKRCAWAVDKFDDPENLPEVAIAAWPRHEWQIQVPNDATYNFPRFELARVTLFGDPRNTTPGVLQHTTFVEIHDAQALSDDEPLLDGTSAVAWYTCFDAMIREYAGADAALSSSAEAFWATMPSPSLDACADYPETPAQTACAVINPRSGGSGR